MRRLSMLCIVYAIAFAGAATPLAWAGLSDAFLPDEEKFESRRSERDSTMARWVTPPLTKLGRGTSNVLSSPFEWPMTIRDTYRRDGWMRATLVAPVRGLGRLCVRMGSGIADIILFPFPPHHALWIKEPSVFTNSTARGNWVRTEADVARTELSDYTIERTTAK